jgi:dynein heavy chain
MMGYRDSCLKAWQNLLDEKQILYTDNYSLQEVLTDANTIGIWVNQQKLPNDKFSIENAIILKNSSRW